MKIIFQMIFFFNRRIKGNFVKHDILDWFRNAVRSHGVVHTKGILVALENNGKCLARMTESLYLNHYSVVI